MNEWSTLFSVCTYGIQSHRHDHDLRNHRRRHRYYGPSADLTYTIFHGISRNFHLSISPRVSIFVFSNKKKMFLITFIGERATSVLMYVWYMLAPYLHNYYCGITAQVSVHKLGAGKNISNKTRSLESREISSLLQLISYYLSQSHTQATTPPLQPLISATMGTDTSDPIWITQLLRIQSKSSEPQ